MLTVPIQLPHHSYEVRIARGLLETLGEQVAAIAPHHKAALIADPNVLEPHGRIAIDALFHGDFDVTTAEMPAGEEHKNLATFGRLIETLIESRLERRSPVVALGGGVVGDTVGFVAASYLRGVPFVQCPTTLLAMVDASVGGKTGVNIPQGKNLVGAFYQPCVVIIDTATLDTLPPRELRCGLAECVKHAVIRDASLFDWIDQHVDAILALDNDTIAELVKRNVEIKAKVVMEDEKEAGVRAHLNFGHTFAHAIEATQGYGSDTGYLHGEAVALGMVAATRLAIDLGRCEGALLDRLVNLLERIGLPVTGDHLADTNTLIETMRVDKKVADNTIRFVLPDQMGAVSIVSAVEDDAVQNAWRAIGAKD